MARTTQSPPEFAGRPPGTRPGFVAAAALLLLVVLAAVAIAVWPSPDRSPDRSGGATSPAPAAPTDRGGARTPTAQPATAVPTTAPAGVTWQLVGQVATPVSATAGPFKQGTTATGYAHTPEGALIAAAQISAHIVKDKATAEATILQQLIPSADRDKLLASVRSGPEFVAQPGERAQYAGFIYQSYTAETAVVGLVTRAPSTSTSRYFVATPTMLWRDGDWRMVPPPGGSFTSISRQANDLTGAVEWGAR